MVCARVLKRHRLIHNRITKITFLTLLVVTIFVVFLEVNFSPLHLIFERFVNKASATVMYEKSHGLAKEGHAYTSSTTALNASFGTSSRKRQRPILRDNEEVPLACAFPNVDPFEPSIVKLSGIGKKTLECDGGSLHQLTYVSGNVLKINQTKVREKIGKEHVLCRYRELRREPHSDRGVETTSWSESFYDGIRLRNNAEFLEVMCTIANEKSRVVSKMYHALVPVREHLNELFDLKLRKRKMEMGPKETLNVLMIGHDGVSRNQLLRGMEKTLDFLMHDFDSFDLTMYTQQGRNTLPNFLPLLTGRTKQEHDKWWKSSDPADVFDLIWYEYEKTGYRTLYTEDYPRIGAFQFQKKGFMYPPSHYYTRPLSLALARDEGIAQSNRNCIGSQPEQIFHLNYVEKFFDTFPENPLFALAFFTQLTHEDMTNNRMMDEHLLHFYKSMHAKGHFNNTLLITFSDHGPRWGAIRSILQGIIERRSPYAILSFPKWFTKKYPDVARNLRLNTKRLTSHVDIHATLWDLLYFKSQDLLPQIPKRHGKSLFSEIPRSRECEDVPIDPEFCLCGLDNMEEIDISSNPDLAKNLSDSVLKAIQSLADAELCAKLQVGRVIEMIKINTKRAGEVLYKLKLQTIPGNALFEASVRSRQMKLTVENDIDRMNKYEGQADCLDDVNKMRFCYCKNLL